MKTVGRLGGYLRNDSPSSRNFGIKQPRRLYPVAEALFEERLCQWEVLAKEKCFRTHFGPAAAAVKCAIPGGAMVLEKTPEAEETTRGNLLIFLALLGAIVAFAMLARHRPRTASRS